MAAAGLLLVSCASDDGVAAGGGDSASFGTVGYIGFSVQLPNATTPSLPTRNNDEYNDGAAEEYAVKTGKVLFFKGATEATATFIQSQNIIDPTTGWNNDGSTKVTSTKTAVAKLDKVTFTSSENLYAYVVLNYEGTDLATNPAAGTTFKAYSEQTLAASQTGGTLGGAISANGLLMTNAPISTDKKGGSADPSGATIALATVLDKDLIKSTQAEAETAPAGCVYVERAAAKVTLELAPALAATDIDMKDQDEKKLALSTSDIKWQIINTEKNFYNGRQANESAWLPYINTEATNANSKYRFVSNDLFSPQVGGSHKDAYRTYFAKDPAYATDYDGSTDALTLDKPVADDNWLSPYDVEAAGKRAYVPENTFPTQYQTRRNTTQATIRVKFNNGTDFYTISNDALYYTKANAQNKVAAKLMADYEVNQKMTAAATWIANNVSGVSGTVTGALTVEITSTTAGAATYTVTPSFTDEASHSYALADITDATTSNNLTTAINTAKGDNTVSLYKGGYAYYNVRIKHFGDVETPWSASGAYVTKPGTTTEQIYNVSNATYGDNYFLGRYGIVRDNWYKLSIDGITKLGSATPPNVTGDPTPDDEIEQEYYISAHVHILPWVIRTQSINF